MAGEERRRSGGTGGRRHIIERPRLTRLLDATDARIILLVAPAGYGKTTLAHQWLKDRPHAWYRATWASSDVAALVAGLAHSAAAITGADVEHIRGRLAHTADPEAEVDLLAGLAGDAFASWPEGGWLAIDDYHSLDCSPAAEAVIGALSAADGVNLLVSSRTRPVWATARRLLYGEVFELGRHDLAMNAAEANEVLGDRHASASSLVALAEGWPAVIGLASLAGEREAPEEPVADALYEFFAEELYQNVDPEDRIRLCQLAVAPAITADLARALNAADGAAVLARATEAGFVTQLASESSMHPLLRQFLLTKFRELSATKRHETVNEVIAFLIDRHKWDEAFSVIEQFDVSDLVDGLVCAGLSEMLAEGRFPTVKQWFEYAQRAGAYGPATRVLEAEIAFRQGLHDTAEAIASLAAAESIDGALRQRALLRAGQSAYFVERYAEALKYLEASVASSEDPTLEREASWMAFIASLDSERSDALDFLKRFEELREPSIDDAVRMSNARLLLAMRRGGITEALRTETGTAHLARRAVDPMVRTAFGNVYGWALVLNGRYEEAVEVAKHEKEDAERNHLTFVVPHAELVAAVGAVGLRELDSARSRLNNVARFAEEHADRYLKVTTNAVRARLLVAEGRLAEAIAATDETLAPRNLTIRVVFGDYLGTRAITLAAAGDVTGARSTVAEVLHASTNAESQALAQWALVIARLIEGEAVEQFADDAFRLTEQLGHLDSLVTAYRAFPPLLEVGRRTGNEALLHELMRRAHDTKLAQKYGLITRSARRNADPSRLSPREEQVLDLVASGRTNEEIAQVLFISAVTVKAHLRHIYEKLGVRNRAEAVAVAASVSTRSDLAVSSSTGPPASPRR